MNRWETNAKFQAITFWNHDNLPSQDDSYVRSFHWLAVSKAVSFCVIPLSYSTWYSHDGFVSLHSLIWHTYMNWPIKKRDIYELMFFVSQAFLHFLCTKLLFQHISKSFTESGRTHQMLNEENKKCHSSLASPQWIRRWSTNSFVLLHIRQWLAKNQPLLLIWLRVRIFPQAAFHVRKFTLIRAKSPTLFFRGKTLLPLTQG